MFWRTNNLPLIWCSFETIATKSRATSERIDFFYPFSLFDFFRYTHSNQSSQYCLNNIFNGNLHENSEYFNIIRQMVSRDIRVYVDGNGQSMVDGWHTKWSILEYVFGYTGMELHKPFSFNWIAKKKIVTNSRCRHHGKTKMRKKKSAE